MAASVNATQRLDLDAVSDDLKVLMAVPFRAATSSPVYDGIGLLLPGAAGGIHAGVAAGSGASWLLGDVFASTVRQHNPSECEVGARRVTFRGVVLSNQWRQTRRGRPATP
jgi:hypothetical protein